MLPGPVMRRVASAVGRAAGQRRLTVDAKAVRYAKHGHPSNVLR
jgi:hypothetical protein